MRIPALALVHILRCAGVVPVLAWLALATSTNLAAAPTQITLLVTTTDDGGPGSLRQALLDANTTEPDQSVAIEFNIPGAGVQSIAPLTELPEISRPLTIDGFTQPGASPNTLAVGSDAVLLVQLTGTNAADIGLSLATGASNSIVRGLVVNRFSYGIVLNLSEGIVLEGNFIGTDATGTNAQANDVGLFAPGGRAHQIGGLTPTSRNVISGNEPYNVWFQGGTGHLVQGNYLGLGADGSTHFPGGAGLWQTGASSGHQIGGTTPGARNVISGTCYDNVEGGTNVYQGNFFGTDATGTRAIGSGDGVWLTTHANVFGGIEPGAGNLVCGRDGAAVIVSGSDNIVAGNLIGTDVTGRVAMGNQTSGGVLVYGANNLIGGTAPEARNVFASNAWAVYLDVSASGNRIEGNYIGTDITGTNALGNGMGVYMFGQSNLVGGDSDGAGNVIAAGTGGILLGGASNVVAGNLIGTDATGGRALGHVYEGIFGQNGTNNVIGGPTPEARNVIAGNSHGIYFYGPNPGHHVLGNYIGTDITGTHALPNTTGVLLYGASDSRIGGDGPGEGNLISGNTGSGIQIVDPSTTNNVIEGNLIGLDATGTTPLPNLRGIGMNSPGNRIGGLNLEAANVIAGNLLQGIALEGTNNAVLGNRIFANGALGLDLLGDGFTPNDPGDADDGPNHFQNFPEIHFAALTGGDVTVHYRVDSALENAAYPLTIEFFIADSIASGEGRTLIHRDTYDTPQVFTSLLFTPLVVVNDGDPLVATATDAQGNTSEFSSPATAATNRPPVLALPIPDQTATFASFFSYTVPAGTFIDPNIQDTLSYQAAGLPPGLDFDPLTRTFSGTPTRVGAFVVTVTATDDGQPSLSIEDAFNLVVDGCSPLLQGLVGWWPGDDSARNLAGDSEGLLVDGAGFGPGMAESAFLLDGIDDHVAGQSPDLAVTTHLTVAAWVKASTIGVFNDLFAKGGTDGDQWDYRLVLEDPAGQSASNAHFRFYIKQDSAFWESVGATNVGLPAVDTWYHVAGAYDGQNLTIYVNGSLEGTMPASFPIRTYDTHFFLGRYPSGGRFFGGSLDEVLVHDRTLSAQEIESIYQSGPGGLCGEFSVPRILRQPQAQTVAEGQSAGFNVRAVGLPQPTYQWRLDGAPIPGANSETLAIPNAQLSDEGIYSVVVSNVMGKVISQTAALTVHAPPSITVHPQSLQVVLGSDAALSVQAAGSPPLSYEWRKDGVPIPGATTQTLPLAVAQPGDSGMYDVVVGNAFGSATSLQAMVVVLEPPGVTVAPVGADPLEGIVTLCVTASGSDPIRYQWRHNGANIPGATNECHDVDVSTPSGSGSYSVVIANEAGTVVAGPVDVTQSIQTVIASDTFSGASLNTEPPRIRASNAGATHEPGEPDHAGKPGGASVWFEFFSPGNGLLTLDTQGSGFDTLLAVYTGGPVDALTLVAQDEDSGGFFTSLVQFNAVEGQVYHIAVDGLAGATGTLYLNRSFDSIEPPVPVILEPPQSLTLLPNSEAAFMVVADTANGPLGYQWYHNESPLADATNHTYTIASVQRSDVGSYSVVVSNDRGGVVRSVPADLEIGVSPNLRSRDKPPDLFLAPPGSGTAPLTGVPGGVVSVALGGSGFHIFDTIGSTASGEDAQVEGLIGGSSQYIGRFRPEAAATMVLDTVGSDFDTTMALFTVEGTTVTGLLAADDDGAGDGSSSRIQFEADPSQDYVVAVDRAGAEEGIVQLNWKLGRLPPEVDQPTEEVLALGGVARLHAEVSDTFPEPSFQWWRDGILIPDATNAHYELSGAMAQDAGLYAVVVSNLMGVVTQQVSRVRVDGSLFLVLASDFESDPQGWRVLNGGDALVPAHVPPSGAQSGYLTHTGEVGAETWFWAAPAQYSGDLRFAYGGRLSFALFKTPTMFMTPDAGVWLLGGGQMLAYDLPAPPGSAWTRYEVPLAESPEWRVGNLDGPPPSREEFLSVLGRLEQIWIRGGYSLESHISGLDSVRLVAPSETEVVFLDITTLPGGDFLLEWIDTAPGFQLQGTERLEGNTWRALPTIPTLQDGHRRVQVAPETGLRYFKLRKQ